MRLSAIIPLLAISSADAELKQSLRGLGRGPAKKNGGNPTTYSGMKSTQAGERKPKIYSFNVKPSTSAAPEADEPLNAAPGFSADADIPNMETAPASEAGIMQANFGGGDNAPGDIIDTPNADDPSFQQAPPFQQDEGLNFAPDGETVDIPSMEPIPPEIAQASSAGWVNPAVTVNMVDTLDTPNDDTGSSPLITTTDPGSVNAAAARDSVEEATTSEPEISAMEGIPESSGAMQAPGFGGIVNEDVGDMVDSPTDAFSSTLSTAGLSSSNDALDGGVYGELAVDGPDMLAPGYTAEGETSTPVEDTEFDDPMILPFGVQAEEYVLKETASVCAVTEEHAVEMCGQLPICKFKKHGDSISTEIVFGQEECVRRCDSPLLGASHCEPHEQCFHFVFGCECATLSADGGKCQPF